jgi:DNA-binding response OmpR family regulator
MNKKVLFVNRINPVSIIPELLTSAGHDVITVYDAEEGLNRLKSQPYDMVILQENAAAESWTLSASIRSLTATPLIVISSGASAETCVKTINAGADFFIRKPFGPMELIARINALFQRVSILQLIPVVS